MMASTGYATYPSTPTFTPPMPIQAFPQRVSAPPQAEFKNLVMIEEKLGSGALALPGRRISVHYTGRLLSSGEVFDTSRGREPFELTLGAGEVIEGWDQGLVGMREGGKRKLIIPATLAYGAEGAPPKIPPGATLVFDVELVPPQPTLGRQPG